MIPILFLLAIASPAAARQPVAKANVSSVSAAMLVEMCSGAETPKLEMDPCNSYILGAVDGLSMGGLICIHSPDSFSIMALGVVRKYIREHPDGGLVQQSAW